MAQEIATREEYRAVGKPVRRIDAAGKVTGKTVYADDMKLPRMLHAKVLGSAYAHARIKSIDAGRARRHSDHGRGAAALPEEPLEPARRHLRGGRGAVLRTAAGGRSGGGPPRRRGSA